MGIRGTRRDKTTGSHTWISDNEITEGGNSGDKRDQKGGREGRRYGGEGKKCIWGDRGNSVINYQNSAPAPTHTNT